MLTIVLILNGLIAGLCWGVVWWFWRWRRKLAQVTAALVVAERQTRQVLENAPQSILQGQAGTQQLQSQYQQALRQLQQIKQIIGLIGLGQFVWRSSIRRAAKQSSMKQSMKHQSPSISHKAATDSTLY